MPHSLLRAKRTNRGAGFTHTQKTHMEVADSFNQRSRVNLCKSHYLRIHKDNRKYQSFQWPFHFLFNFFGISNMCAFFIKPYCEMFVWLLNIWLNVLKKPFGIFLRNRIFSMREVKFQIMIFLHVVHLCIYETSSTIPQFNFQVSFQHGLGHQRCLIFFLQRGVCSLIVSFY